jgi:hypothetical protein
VPPSRTARPIAVLGPIVFAALAPWPAACGSADTTPDAGPDVARPMDPDCGRPDADDAAADATAPADDGGAADGAADAAPATFAELYDDYFGNPCYASSCTGRLCHDPGHQMGVNLLTRPLAFESLSMFVTPGDPEHSDLIRILRTGTMPTGRPKMPPADIARVASWIADGARDD